MRLRSPPSLLGLLTALVFLTALGASLTLEGTLTAATGRARGTLPRALTTELRAAELEGDAALLTDAARLTQAGQLAPAADLLAARTEEVTTPSSHRLASEAALAAADYRSAARHAALARRLEPTAEAPDTKTAEAVDLALLARLRPIVRFFGAASGVGLVLLLARSLKRRRYRRDLARWLQTLGGRVVCRVDGEAIPEGKAAPLGPRTSNLTVDVFLDQYDPYRRRPRPGPTLAVVLSQGASNRSIRLTPHHDVQGDAVRIPVKDATLARILECPGSWRLQATVDGNLVGEARLAVAPPPPSAGRKLLRLVGHT